MRGSRTIVLAATAVALAGCQKAPPPKRPSPTPVTVLTLRVGDPSLGLRLTGSAEAWKQENIGFEVAGRVAKVLIERESFVEGQTVDEQGRALTKGTVLAVLDRTRYQVAVDEARAGLAVSKAKVAAVQAEIASVLPAQLAAAKAQSKQAKNELKRLKQAMAGGNATGLEVERQQAGVDVAEAEIRRINAMGEGQKAQFAGAEAQVRQAAEALRQAELDLAKCELRCPFSGQISKLHVIPGAYVQPGSPVVQVTVMDPMTVVVALSPTMARWVNEGDRMDVTPAGMGPRTRGFLRRKEEDAGESPDQSEPKVSAFIYQKDSIADPNLRTFKVTLLVRNYQEVVDLPGAEDLRQMISLPRFVEAARKDGNVRRLMADPELGPLLAAIEPNRPPDVGAIEKLCANSRIHSALYPLMSVRDVLPVLVKDPTAVAPLYLEVKCLDPGEQFVWKVMDLENPLPGRRVNPVVRLKKVFVRPGKDRLSLLGLYTFREFLEVMTGPEGQAKKRPDLANDDLLATGVPAWVRDGDRVLLVRKRWIFRPGDLIDVHLSMPGPGRGLYVPMQAIVAEAGDRRSVFVAEPHGAGALRARKVPVKLLGQLGERRRIAGEGLAEGTKVILHGASLLVPGEPVRITEEKKVLP
ncbi:MAG TPA: HlyD family efflux transporter periplasmic adaptor subunit [Phycisphaerae bacterium]|nr:HlyD family efflux transporter periplasmic adaptor subunit [Phycisphaerae bacterium]